MTIVYLRRGVIQIRKDNVSALHRRYIPSRPPGSYGKLKQPPSVFSPLSARVDVRRCRRGFACAPIHHSTVGCVIYHEEKTSSIDNLLEELARVHANFWIIMPRRVHYASYRRPPSPPSDPLLPPRLAPALEMLQLSAPPAYPRQLHFAINLRYRTCDRIRRGSRGTGKLRVGSWQTRGLHRYPAMAAKSISKENIISGGKIPLNSVVNKRFNL